MSDQKIVASSSHLLTALEENVLAGTWTWHFATDEHRWSVGLYRLFGLQPYEIRPSFEAFTELVHPDDKLIIPSSNDIKRGCTPNSWIRRLILPNRSMKTIQGKSDIHYSSHGNPAFWTATVVDITNNVHLAQAKAVEQRSLRVLTSRTGSFAWRLSGKASNFGAANLELAGQDRWEMPDNWSDESFEEFRSQLLKDLSSSPDVHNYDSQSEYNIIGKDRARMIYAISAVSDPALNVDDFSWFGFAMKISSKLAILSDFDSEKNIYMLMPSHFRAARSILNLSLSDIAVATGVSVSSMRRVEAGDLSVGVGIKKAIAQYLVENGIKLYIDRKMQISMTF